MNGALDEALRALPHGPGFRFVDRLTSLEPGRRGAGEFLLRDDAAFLPGHFPGQPLMPGVLLVEAVAQLGGVVAQSDPALAPLSGLKLTGIRAAKILGSASPGQVISLRAEVVARMGNLIQISGSASTGDQEILRCEVVLAGTG